MQMTFVIDQVVEASSNSRLEIIWGKLFLARALRVPMSFAVWSRILLHTVKSNKMHTITYVVYIQLMNNDDCCTNGTFCIGLKVLWLKYLVFNDFLSMQTSAWYKFAYGYTSQIFASYFLSYQKCYFNRTDFDPNMICIFSFTVSSLVQYLMMGDVVLKR